MRFAATVGITDALYTSERDKHWLSNGHSAFVRQLHPGFAVVAFNDLGHIIHTALANFNIVFIEYFVKSMCFWKL